jgi:GNAT superfamily N-acetyltransferase
LTFSVQIIPYAPKFKDAILTLSIAAWEPVFSLMQKEVPDYVYATFYPDGWQARQIKDIENFLDAGSESIWIAVQGGKVLGWIGGRIHVEDNIGEVYILAVHPEAQRLGISHTLMYYFEEIMRNQGMKALMVETGDDTGHAPSRASYESFGFERWPVARYFRRI